MSSLSLTWILLTFVLSLVTVSGWEIDTNNSTYDGFLNLQFFDADIIQEYGARCLDGSPAGLYYRAGIGNRFVIYLEGGAYCNSESDCIARSQTALGSSNYWAPQIVPYQPSDILSNNITTNPYFGSFHAFYIPYCSGDLWLGSNTQPSAISWNLTFAGTPIFNAAVQFLIRKYRLAHATEVVLTGVSAGGMGVFYHLDNFAKAVSDLTNGNAYVVGVPQAGWFSVANFWDTWLVTPDLQYLPPVPDTDTLLFVEYIVNYTAPPTCIDLTDSIQKYNCTFYIPGYYQYVNTPLFVAENLFDAFQIFWENLAPQGTNSTEYAYEKYFGNTMRASLEANIVHGNHQGNALWAPPCLEHALTYSGPNAPTIKGNTFMEALLEWYFALDDLLPEYRWSVSSASLPTCFANQ